MIKIEKNSNESPESQQYHPPKRHYKDIDHKSRLSLIKMVIEEKMKVSEASKVLKINLSTAKFIVSSYKKKGRIMKKKSDDLKQMLQEQRKKIREEVIKQLKEEKQIKQEKNQNVEYPMPPYPILPYGFIPY